MLTKTIDIKSRYELLIELACKLAAYETLLNILKNILNKVLKMMLTRKKNLILDHKNLK